MSGRIADTNVVSFQIKRHSLASAYARHLTGYDAYVSFQTAGELHEWAAVRKWGRRRRAEMDSVLTQYTVLHSTPDICLWWAYVRSVRRVGPAGVADAWIAATALAYGLELVTHNPADFAGIPGLTIITEAT